MKTLYLLRHGQAPWSPQVTDDFHRPLNEIGERQAAAVGLRLARAAAKPEMIVASPADRTRETARIVAKALSHPEKGVVYAGEIYAADVRLLARLAQQYPSSVKALLMVGHNPTLADFGEWLTGERLGHLDTCGLLAIGFDLPDWSAINRGAGRLLWRSEDR